MTHSPNQALWYHIKRFMRVSIFFLHAGLLVPGILFWIVFLLLHGDMTAFALASDNLISHYLAASMAEQQNFLNLLGVVGAVIYVIVAGFRWPSLWRVIRRENPIRSQKNE